MEKGMLAKLEDIEHRFVSIDEQLSQPGLSGNELTKLSKERAEIEGIVETFRKCRDLKNRLTEAKEMLEGDDTDMADLAKEEVSEITPELEQAEAELTVLLLPSDPNDAKNVILEVRAGTGGDEAALFAGDLFRMYQRYADSQKWKIELLSSTEAEKGGFKEVIALVTGTKVYSRMKFEMGVHRVQRVPETESQGRIHTSACTVAVLPEASEVEIDINPKDLEIKVCRASGAGGQHVNTTDSAVRIVHLPTGIAVECQDERSQHKNKDKAMKVLQTRLYDQALREQNKEISADRKSQVGSGDRSERIRTYNFPQGRVTDHRVNVTLYKLEEFMQGGMTEILDALGAAHTAELLNSQQEN